MAIPQSWKQRWVTLSTRNTSWDGTKISEAKEGSAKVFFQGLDFCLVLSPITISVGMVQVSFLLESI